MTKRRSKRKARASQHLRQQALGFAVMLVALGGAFAGSRAYGSRAPQEAVAPPAEARPSTDEITMHIEEVSARYGIDPRLVAAIIAVESEFNPNAVSRRGAEGLMQLMPETAAIYDVQDSFDAHDNIEGGVRHLRRLMDHYRGDLPLVLAAYNAGEQAVRVYHGIPPYRETRRYVVQVLVRYDRDAARAVARRFTSPATRKPAFARGARVMFVAPAVSAVALGAETRALSVPASLPTSVAVSAPASLSAPTGLSGRSRLRAPAKWPTPANQSP